MGRRRLHECVQDGEYTERQWFLKGYNCTTVMRMTRTNPRKPTNSPLLDGAAITDTIIGSIPQSGDIFYNEEIIGIINTAKPAE